MQWILFYQKPIVSHYGIVKFITSDIDSPTTLSYTRPDFKFITFLKENFPDIKNFPLLKKELDSYKTIFLQKDGSWEVKLPTEMQRDYSFNELVQLKEKQKEDKKKENDTGLLRIGKKFLNHLHIRKRNSKYSAGRLNDIRNTVNVKFRGFNGEN